VRLLTRQLNKQDVRFEERIGYYIRLRAEYYPLSLIVFVTMRRWNGADGMNREEAETEALKLLNNKLEKVVHAVEKLII